MVTIGGLANNRVLWSGFCILLIIGLLYPATSTTERRQFTIGVYYLYHFNDDLPAKWRENVSAAMDIAIARLNNVDPLDNYQFTYQIVDAFQIKTIKFGDGSNIPEFDSNRTMNRVLQELLSPDSGFQATDNNFSLKIFVFPLSKCISKQYTIISANTASPIFLSYNAVLAEINFDRFMIEHEILHTFGLPDRLCSQGTNCHYPDDNRSVMAEHPAYFYLSRSDYAELKHNGLIQVNLLDLANRPESAKPYDPRLQDNGSCPSGIKPTREWRLIYGPQS